MPAVTNITCEVCGKSLNDADLEANVSTGDGTLRRYVIQSTCWRGLDGSQVEYKSLKTYYFCGITDMKAFVTNFIDPFMTP